MVLEHQQDAETKEAGELDFDEYRLVTGAFEVNQTLEKLDFNHDPESNVLEDSYHALFIKGDEYWGCHKATPLVNSTVYRIQ